MKRCTRCNNEIKPNEKFCGSCGEPVPVGKSKSNASTIIIVVIVVILAVFLLIGGLVACTAYATFKAINVNNSHDYLNNGDVDFDKLDTYIENINSLSEDYTKFFKDVELNGKLTEDELVKALGYDDKNDLQDSCKKYLEDNTTSNAMICFYDSNYAKTSTINDEGVDLKASQYNNDYNSVNNIVDEVNNIMGYMKQPLDNSVDFKRYYDLSYRYIMNERNNIEYLYTNYTGDDAQSY